MTNLLLFATFQQILSKILYILVAVLILLFMITIHELGHYTAGSLLGFKINEFAIGFGPKLYSRKKKNGQVFSVRAVPLGGFCAFEGEDEDSDNKEAFNNQKPWKRLIVLFAGAFFNFISAVLIAVIAFSAIGEPVLTVNKIYESSPNYANQTIEEGDILYAVDGKKVYLAAEYSEMIANAGETLEITVFRPKPGVIVKTFTPEYGEFLDFTLEKGDITARVWDEEKQDYVINTFHGIGILSQYYGRIDPAEPDVFAEIYKIRYTFGQSLGRSLPYCLRVGTVVLKTLGKLVTGKIALDSVGGPITTIDVVSQVAASDFANIFYLIMMISVNLAVFNLLPIPALDGSRMVFVLVEWIRGKPVNRKVEGIVHLVGFVFLMVFVVLIDVLKWFI